MLLRGAELCPEVGFCGKTVGVQMEQPERLEIPAEENFLGSWKDGKGSGKWRVMKKCAMKKGKQYQLRRLRGKKELEGTLAIIQPFLRIL